MTIHLDYETFSACDIKKCGAYRYAFDASTEILMIGLAVDDGEPVLWLPGQNKRDLANMKADVVLEKLADPDTTIVAHNAQFEIAITDALFTRTTGFPAPAHHQWRCTAALARRAALPASLAKCAEVLKLPQQKDSKGMALIRKFGVPQKPKANSKKVFRPRIYPHDEPEAFYQFGQYCLQDVRTEQAIGRALKPFELKGFALETFLLDIEINARGLPVNLAGLRNALKLVNEVTADVGRQFKELTGLDHTQSAKFLAWLKSHGYTGDDLRAETLEDQLEEMEFADDSLVGRALKLRQQVSFAAVKKIPAMLACAGPHDNRVRGTLIWHGASTGRWSGSLVQPQNFKRPTVDLADYTQMAYADICRGVSREYLEVVYGSPLDVVASSIRHFIHDFDGVNEYPMLSADYAAIEARIVCWLAGQEDALEEYRQGIDRYKRMASVIFRKPENEINKHPERFIGKQTILGCGYSMSGPKFRLTCEKFGYYDLEEKMEFTAVEAFRERHPAVVKLWRDTENAAKNAINNPGARYNAGKLVLFCKNVAGMKYLFLKLPSGRNIAYPEVRLEPQIRYTYQDKLVSIINPTAEDHARAVKRVGEHKVITNKAITFFGQIPLKSIWGRISTYGAKLAENATQGVAADVMANGMLNAEREGYPAYTTIHDEFLGSKRNSQKPERLNQLLATLPDWGAGLPIEVEGDTVPYYLK